MNLVPNVCVECNANLEGKQAWVRSGRLLCSTCDFAHKAPSRQIPRKARQPRPKATYWKPQVFKTNSMSWQDIQVVCSTPHQATDVAMASLPRGGGRVRAMEVRPDGTRIPGEPITVKGAR